MRPIEIIFIENLTRIMEQRHLSKDDLAKMLDIKRESIYKWMSYQNFPKTENINALMDVLHVGPDKLFCDHSQSFDSDESIERLVNQLMDLAFKLKQKTSPKKAKITS